MTTKIWISGAPQIAQVTTATVAGTPAVSQVYTVSMGINNTKTVSYTALVSDTNTTIATALQALLAASTYPEFVEETWANPSAGVITATGNTAGVPFTLTSSATGTGTFVSSTTTTNSGPNDVNLAANWSTNALPANGDDVYITGTGQGLLYNLDALAAIVLNTLTFDTTFTGQCGLLAQNANGYEEYRPRYFQIKTPTETYLAGTGGGSQLIQRDNGSQAWTVNVSATGSPITQGRPALLLKGSSGSNVLTVTRGVVGSAIDPGDTAVWATVNVGYQTSQRTDVTLTLGSGCTVTTIDQTGGIVNAFTSATTWTQQAGTAYLYGTGTITTLDVEGGTFLYQSNGTCTTLTVGTNGTADYRSDPRSRTVTNSTVYGTLLDPNKTVTFTNPVSFPQGVPSTTMLGTEIHLQRS